MSILRFALVLAFAAPAATQVALADEPLFKLDGKTYSGKDLPPAQQQQLLDLRLESYTRLEQLSDQVSLDLYLESEAKQAGKPRAEVEAKLLGVSEPTDKEVSDWFNANRSRIPPGYALEKISGEIKNGLREQAKKEKRDDLIAKLKKSGKITFLVPEPESPTLKLETAGAEGRGPDAAKVTVVEFADYQCPHCKVAAPILDGLVKKYDGKVRLLFMDYPIKGEFSELTAQGAYCAGKQGKFWAFHDAAYDKQATLASKEAPLALAKDLKLDTSAFTACLTGPEAKARVNKSRAEGDRIGLTGTPAIYVNGHRVRGYEAADVEKAIQRAL